MKIVTTNAERAALLSAAVRELGLEAVIVAAELGEPQADSVDSVARAKAAAAARSLGGPLLVEDSGLAIPELGGFPGPYLKYVLATLGAERLVALAGGMACRFASVLVLVDASGERHALELTLDGTVCVDLAATAGPDVWRLFVPGSHGRPFAELPPDLRGHLVAAWRARITSWLRGLLP